MYNEIMKKEEINFPKHSAIVAISNSQISAVQRKAFDGLIFVAREQLRTEPINYKYTVPAEVLLRLTGIGNDNYAYLNKFLSRLRHIDIKYNALNKDKKHKWGEFSMLAGYDYEKGIITYSFPHQIQDALIDPNVYAWIDMRVIKGLRSKYTITLYELAQDYINIGHPITMELKKFRAVMGVPEGKYKLFAKIRERIIDAPVNEINDNDHIKFTISVTPKKTGRTYSHVVIFIKKKPKIIEVIENPKQIEYTNIAKQNAMAILSMIPTKHRSAAAERLLNKFTGKGLPYIKAQIIYVNKSDGVVNYLAYLKKSLLNDWAGFNKNGLTEQVNAKEQTEASEQTKARQEGEQEEQRRKQEEEEEIKRLEDFYGDMRDEEKEQIRAEALIRLHEKHPNAPAKSATFGELSVEITIRKIIRERLEITK